MSAPTLREQQLAQALAELGKLTPDGIADLMRAKEIKGVQHETCGCPIAVYLQQLGFDDVEVSPDGALEDPWKAWFAGPDGAPTGEEVALPDTVAEFARRFDDGVYLDLIVVAPIAAVALDYEDAPPNAGSAW